MSRDEHNPAKSYSANGKKRPAKRTPSGSKSTEGRAKSAPAKSAPAQAKRKKKAAKPKTKGYSSVYDEDDDIPMYDEDFDNEYDDDYDDYEEADDYYNKPRKNGKNTISKVIGIVLALIQGGASGYFMYHMMKLGMIPNKYMIPLGAALAVLFVLVLVSQILSKHKGILGKVISVLMSIVLIFGGFYVGRGTSAIDKMTSNDTKTDAIAVAVLKDDAAEKIQDASTYTFGVQYAMGGDDIKSAVDAVNTELGSTVTTTEYPTLAEEAAALLSGEVQAMVYNTAYDGILEESVDDSFSSKVKIIYSHAIEKKVDKTDTAAEVDTKDNTFTVFISGIDVYGDITTNSRSDVNIIATVNPTTHQVLLVTTPRDYYVQIPNISGDSKDKLTHAGIYGVDASMQTLEQLYDTNIDFYARVNFTSLVDIVDALGGVDVDSEIAFTTSEDAGMVVNIVQGTNSLSGKQALAFCRERHNLADGDYQRGKNQEAVIKGLIKKMCSPAILTSANSIIDSVSGNVDTNMSSEQIQALIKQQLADGAAWNVHSEAASGSGDTQYCYSMPNTPLYVCQPDQASVDTIKGLIDQVENGQTLDNN